MWMKMFFLGYLLAHWAFLGFSFSLMRLFLGAKIWTYLHLPNTDIPEHPLA